MGMLKLPTELLDEIFSYLRVYTDIRELCLVCKRLREVASPILYHSVVLRAHHRDIIDQKDQRSLIDLPGHSCLDLIEVTGIEARSCGIPTKAYARIFAKGIDDMLLKFVERLGGNQLKGFIICEALLSSRRLLLHLTIRQQNIVSFYEGRGVRRLLPLTVTREGVIDALLSGRKGLRNITFSELAISDAVPLVNLLKANEHTLESLEVDLGGIIKTANQSLGRLLDTSKENFAEAIRDILEAGGINMSDPPRLTRLRKLVLFQMNDLPPASLDAWSKSIVDYSNLTFLKLWFCGAGGMELLTTPGIKLQLKTLWIVDLHTYEGPDQVLSSFQGLKELVLDYPHSPRKLLTPITHHAATLEKLYWRSIIDQHKVRRQRRFPTHNTSGLRTKNWDNFDFRMFDKLKELGLCVCRTNPDCIDLNLPSGLELFHVLLTGHPPVDNLHYPHPSDIVAFMKRLSIEDVKELPFKYFVMGFQKHFKQWPTVLEFYTENLDSIKAPFVATKDYAFRELGEDELEKFHPHLGFPSEMEDWMPWDIRRKFAAYTKTTKFCAV